MAETPADELDLAKATTETPKYPEIEVQLTGESENAFFIMGRVRAALRRAGVSSEEQEAYINEAAGGTFKELLATTMRWVTVL